VGLDRDGIAFLLAAQRRLGVDFNKTLMFGRQSLLTGQRYVRAAFADNGVKMPGSEARALVARGAGYTEPLLARLGAHTIDSLDASDFENSTIIHDLNEPLPATLREQFSVVIDGGTLEHVFDYLRALRSAMEAVRLDGHLLMITPTSGFSGHGFYQLSPELFYRALAAPSGFRMVYMALKPLHWRSQWRQVPDPAVARDRVLWRGSWPTLLYVVARREEIKSVLTEPPTQSDYVPIWKAGSRSRAPRRAAAAVTSRLPLPMIDVGRSLATWRSTRSPLSAVKLTDIRPAE
jgi:hypothetical protein